jgi:hypothetical protein
MRKLITACMALAAFLAFAVMPSVASASPELTDSAGKTVAVGTGLTGKNVGNTTFTGGFNVVCSSAHLEGEVTENSGSSVKGEVPAGKAVFTGTGTEGDCTSALGSVKVTVNSALCLSSTKVADQLEVTGCGANVTFTLAVTSGPTCKYSTPSVLGTFTTAPKDLQVTVSEQEATREEGGFLCPASGKLDMVFDLTTTAGGTVTAS